VSSSTTDEPAVDYCTFHPDRETLLTCTRCDRPACPDCLVQAAVGRHCVGCVKEHAKAAPGVARELSSRQRKQRRPGWVFWSIVGLWVVLGIALGLSGYVYPGEVPTGLKAAGFVFVVAGWVVSLCIHEWAHAYVAYRTGDYSVVGRGYLTLDPRKYADPIFSVAIPIAFLILGGIGLPGGAVWIDKGNIRSRHHQSLVSLAGPAVNIVFGVICLGLVKLGVFEFSQALESSMAYLGWLEFATAALNLLPVPGLDGYGAIEPYLPYGVRAAINPFANYAIMILLVLMISVPEFGSFLFDIATEGTEAMGVDLLLVGIGQFIGDVQLT
jgi:Zn-dependent protease